MKERALELLRTHGLVDLHADTLLWMRHVGYDFSKRHQNRLPLAPYGWHVDIPRLRESFVKVQLFGIVTLPFLGNSGCSYAAMQTLELMESESSKVSDSLAIIRSTNDFDTALATGKTAGILSLEGAHALEGDIDNLKAFYDAGLRSLGLAHFHSNRVAPCAYGPGSSHSLALPAFGRQVVDYCDEVGIVVDLAHVGRQAFLDACQQTSRPRIVSHTGLSGAFAHWRNIDDEQVKAIAETGGVVGVIFAPRFLGADGARAVAAHIAHGVRVAGEDTMAVGSDFDGFIVPASDLRGAECYPRLVEALLEEGLSENVIGKVLSGNAIRALRDGL